MLSEACKYGIRAVVYLATQHDDDVKHTVREIAAAIKAPQAFVAKILQDLSREHIISAAKGPNGGMFLTKAQARQPLLNVINAIDGMQVFTACGLGLPACNASRPCPIHHEYARHRDGLLYAYKHTRINTLANNVEVGDCVLHR
ncbi:MAG: Rrf2 family transcriptional regulator [Bradyrhizobiaceae bacterium]|nr:Rrf2 family transcriptional regulator [Bradyrhizobiaceae bacterium]